MQTVMLRLDALIRRRRTLVLALWALVVAAAVPFAMQQSDRLVGGGFSVPGSQSAAVSDAVERDFERGEATTLSAVLLPRDGATPADVRAALDRVGRAADAAGDVRLAPADRAAALRTLERDGVRPLIVPLATGVGDDDAIDLAIALREQLGLSPGSDSAALDAAVTAHLLGVGALWAGFQDLTKEDLLEAETTGFPIVLLILLAVFGSLVAALLPIALGAVSVVVTGALIFFLSGAMEMSIFVTNMASMIGIGVAVDYSLFVLARYREEIAAGRTPDDARAVALATSGVAVTFSGIAVVVSLAGLLVVDATAPRSMALGAIIVVAVAVVAAATLLPALISLAGRRAWEPGRIAGVTGAVARLLRRGRPPRGDFWPRWANAVMRRPLLAGIGSAAVMIALALPALDLTTSNGALEQFPPGHETRVAAETAARIAGPGVSGPLQLVVPREQLAATRAALRADAAIARVERVVPSRDGRTLLVTAVPRVNGESDAARALVDRLRAAVPPGVLVGGSPADGKDFDERVMGSMWLVVLFVLGLSYIVLLLLLRSLVLPLKAVAMNLLSVGAAMGVLVAVFQWGWLAGPLGLDANGGVDPLTPPLVLAIVFGLSMDYEVFLLTRIRERWAATGDPRASVAEGLQASARTITSAALIMCAVFAVFVTTGVASIQQLGVGIAVAVALDATLVRLVLVPATMELLGRWNWWLPRRLARVLPKLVDESAPSPGRA